jgi:chitinase
MSSSVVCYFTNWAWYRGGIGKFSPENIDPKLCSHIIYSFAILDPDSLLIKSCDTWADIDNKFYQKVTSLKKKGIKVSLAIGGWNDSQTDKYSRLICDAAARARFNSHVVGFLIENNFQGLDIDYEYPKANEKQYFSLWVKELKQAFAPHGLLLSAAVSGSKTKIDAGYDVPTLAKNLDFLNLMSYDYHGHWDGKTGHVSPLKAVPETDTDPTLNTEFSVNYWIQLGMPKQKIMMGIPMYGQTFTLSNPSNTNIGSLSNGGGLPGEFTKQSGMLSYYEILDKTQKQGWSTRKDSSKRMGPYSWKGDQWVGYDDEEIVEEKAKFIKVKGLGGAMIWCLDMDDFQGSSGRGSYPLLSTINKTMDRI